jgi:hypothetical protein
MELKSVKIIPQPPWIKPLLFTSTSPKPKPDTIDLDRGTTTSQTSGQGSAENNSEKLGLAWLP